MKQLQTLNLAIEFYEQIKELKLTGYTKNQLLHSATAIAMHLSEGFTKSSTEDQRNSFYQAEDALIECQVILKMMSEKQDVLIKTAGILEAHIRGLLQTNVSPSP